MTDETNDPKLTDRNDAKETESDIYGKAPDGKAPLPAGVPEEDREAYEAHQEELRQGRGDTRVTPISHAYPGPKIMTPLEQATVPVQIPQTGATITVNNAEPVNPPAGDDAGLVVTSNTGGEGSDLQKAVTAPGGIEVDAAAGAVLTDDEALAAGKKAPKPDLPPADEFHADTANPAGVNYGAE